MKIKCLKFVIPCIASLACLTSCDGGGLVPDYKGTYYDGYNLDYEGTMLVTELQKLCFKKHTVFVKYKDYKTYASFTTDHISSEAAPSTVKDTFEASKKSGKNEYFYTGKIGAGIGTREHVWPCANSANLWVHDEDAGKHYVDGTSYKGGGSDLYHVRPSTPYVNTARGNSKYCDFDDPEFADIKSSVVEITEKGGQYPLLIQGAEINPESGKYEYANKAEPADEYKGDIARILVYVWVHYGYHGQYYNHEDMIGRLDLTNVMAYPDPDRCYSKLVEWNEMDPPSDTEKLRNNTVEGMQGNRNPFVDHPELMRKLWF